MGSRGSSLRLGPAQETMGLKARKGLWTGRLCSLQPGLVRRRAWGLVSCCSPQGGTHPCHPVSPQGCLRAEKAPVCLLLLLLLRRSQKPSCFWRKSSHPLHLFAAPNLLPCRPSWAQHYSGTASCIFSSFPSIWNEHITCAESDVDNSH